MPQNNQEWVIEIFVTLKPSVLDPQGATVQRELNALGYDQLTSLRLGKYFKLTMAASLSRGEMEKQVKHMCDKLLANPVIETYRYQVLTSPAASGPAAGKKARA
jgi:phosphoribosylformylglycinamidine synthase